MTRIHLLDCDRQKHAAAAGFVSPDCFDPWNSRVLEFFPNRSATEKTAVVRIVIRRSRRKISHNDRIVPVANCIDLNNWRRPAAACVISEPFSERSLVACLVSRESAFDNDFGGSWNRQAGFSLENLDCFAFQPSCDFELAYAIRNLQARYKKQHRIVSHRYDYRAVLTASPIFLHDETAVFPRRNV